MPLLLSARKWLVLMGLVTAVSHSVQADVAFSLQGGEYRIADSMTGDQVYPQAAFNSSAGYVIWQDNATDGDGFGISARRLGPNLSGNLSSFRVNTHAAGDQRNPQVAMLKDGGAVFVWEGGLAGKENISARFLSAHGRFLTGELQVNTYTAQHQVNPAVATLQDGNVIIVWASYGQDGDLMGVYGQRYSPGGERIGGEFQVNQTTRHNQRNPAVAALPNGNFVVIWVSESFKRMAQNRDPAGRVLAGGLEVFNVGVVGRIYRPDGTPVGNEIMLSGDSFHCANPDISAFETGFSVVWAGKLNEPRATEEREGWNIFSRTFDLSGGAVTEALRLNEHTLGDQYLPRISSLNAEQLVVWGSLTNDGSYGGGISARLLSLEGAPISREFRVNTTTAGPQTFAAVASDGDRRYLVVWSSFGPGPTGFDLFAQRYASAPGLNAPGAPYISALSQSRLSLTWPELAGYTDVEYHLYQGEGAAPVVTKNNSHTVSGLAPGTSYSFRLGIRLGDGRSSPVSEAAVGRTWGEDNNFDGLPDDWQELHWGPDRSKWPRADEDSDGDGATNLEEFLAGTNPTDPASVLRMEIAADSQGTRLHWNTEPGLIYQVQVSTKLDGWENLGLPRFAAGSRDSLPVHLDGTVRIYRVIRVR